MSARSAQFSFGRCGCRRCRTASWWRRIKISAVFQASSRRDSRSHAAICVIRRKTNRRHMIGDHHDRIPGEQLCWSGACPATAEADGLGDGSKRPSLRICRASRA